MMKRKAILILPKAKCLPHFANYDYIAVDGGLKLFENSSIKPQLIIGDFDSYQALPIGSNVIQLDPIKDDTDTLAALKYLDLNNYSEIIIYGGLQGRFDHSLANLLLLQTYPNLVLMDEQNKIRLLQADYELISDYTYFSLFTLTNCELAISDAKYNIERTLLTLKDTYGVSNEVSDKALIKVYSGSVYLVESND